MEPSRKHKSYFTRAEVARMFEVAPNTVNRWVRGRKVPSVLTPGGRRRYPVEAILQLVQGLMQGDSTPAPQTAGSEKKARRRRPGTSRRIPPVGGKRDAT